jgi:hypothetical protein
LFPSLGDKRAPRQRLRRIPVRQTAHRRQNCRGSGPVEWLNHGRAIDLQCNTEDGKEKRGRSKTDKIRTASAGSAEGKASYQPRGYEADRRRNEEALAFAESESGDSRDTEGREERRGEEGGTGKGRKESLAAEAAKTDLAVARAEYEHAIAVLTGKPPAVFTLAAIPLTVDMPALPPVPGVLPAQLLERRPDIAAEERRMASANEQIGIAQAAFYPALSLSAVAGFAGTSALNWLTWPS